MTANVLPKGVECEYDLKSSNFVRTYTQENAGANFCDPIHDPRSPV